MKKITPEERPFFLMVAFLIGFAALLVIAAIAAIHHNESKPQKFNPIINHSEIKP